MKLKINSIPVSAFDASGLEDIKVRANGKEISRRDIVSVGRLVATEYVGSRLNQRPNSDKYVSRLNGADYGTLSQKHRDDILLFCASIANKAVGKEAPASVEDVRNDISYSRNETFLRTLAAITKDVIQPLVFRFYDDVSAGGLMQWEPIPLGGTKEIEIRSNDVFLFEDSSWGSGRSASYNELYAKTITLNPKMYACQAKIKWYQDVVNGDPGYYYAAIMNGMYNKIFAIFMHKLTTATANTAYIPAGLTASTYTTANWNKITTLVAAANGVRREDLLAFGKIDVLSKVLPTDGAGAAITGLQYGLGEEWFRRGFLPNAAGVQLLEVQPVIVPGTQNSSLDTIDTGNNLFIAAKGGYGYAPIYAGYYEGSPILLDMTPSETADFTIDINCSAMFDVKEVFGSKVGVITNIA
nr:MAG TPA: hypothetical protein [Caudoviricetes sp.]